MDRLVILGMLHRKGTLTACGLLHERGTLRCSGLLYRIDTLRLYGVLKLWDTLIQMDYVVRLTLSRSVGVSLRMERF